LSEGLSSMLKRTVPHSSALVAATRASCSVSTSPVREVVLPAVDEVELNGEVDVEFDEIVVQVERVVEFVIDVEVELVVEFVED